MSTIMAHELDQQRWFSARKVSSLVAVGVVVAAIMTLGQGLGSQQQLDVRAQKFIVVDPNGVQLASLGASIMGGVQLSMKSPDNKDSGFSVHVLGDVVTLEVGSKASSIMLESLGKNGAQIRIQKGEHDAASIGWTEMGVDIDLEDLDGSSVGLGADGLFFKDRKGQKRMGLIMTDVGPIMQMYDNNERQAVSLFTASKSDGCVSSLEFADSKGNQRASITLVESEGDNGSMLSLRDSKGLSLFTTPSAKAP